MLPYGGAGTSLSPATHYTNAYDFANQYTQAQLDAAANSFPYGTSPAVAAAAAAAVANNPANVANYAYAALAQQALQPTLAAYQQ